MLAPHKASAEPPALRRSRRRERYELQREIGGGGMGTVYQALDRELNRTVAVKVLRPELAPDLRNLLRLKRELVLAARVNDEHVVRVHDIGAVDGRALIAMDWVDGESLAQLLGRVHSLPPSQVYTFAVQIVHALCAIHAAHVVHRDLKPGNLLIRRDGQILVSDFGLARSAEPQDLALTQTGEAGGTPRYMAPEQLAGLPADARSDLYSFGMVLLEMLTGTTALESLAPLRLRLLAASGDRERRSSELHKLAILEGVIRGCLYPDRTERYASADAVCHDLQTVDSGASQSTVKSRRLWLGRKRWLASALCLAMALLALAGYFVKRRDAEAKALVFYTQALSHITPQSAEPELRIALQSLDQALSNNPRLLPAIHTRLETLIRLFDKSGDPQWLSAARAALHSSGKSLPPQESILIESKVDVLDGQFLPVVSRLQGNSALLASSADANLMLARALSGLGRDNPALLYYRAAVRLSPELWRAHNELGSTLLSMGRSSEAAREFQRVTKLKPDSPVGYANLGAALLETGDLKAARHNLEIALERGPSASAYFNLGVAGYYAREYATSIPFFESAIRMRPQYDRYVGGLADILRHLRRTAPAHDAYAQALALLETLAQSRPLSPSEQCRRAIYFARLGDPSAAEATLNTIGGTAHLPDLPFARAILELVQGRLSAANRQLKDAVQAGYPSALIELDPDFDDVY